MGHLTKELFYQMKLPCTANLIAICNALKCAGSEVMALTEKRTVLRVVTPASAGFFHGLIFDPEDGVDVFPLKVLRPTQYFNPS
jgi:hypothetical protein